MYMHFYGLLQMKGAQRIQIKTLTYLEKLEVPYCRAFPWNL